MKKFTKFVCKQCITVMDGKNKTLTIKDIALHTGLSKGTVDRVLHNRGEVSKKSYDKVMKYIEESGYTPNVHASLLASGSDRQIAVLLPHHDPGSFWELAQQGLDDAEKEVSGLGVQIRRIGYEQFDLDAFQKACDEVVSLHPDGVVVAPMFRAETTLLTRRLRQAGIPYVFIDSKLEEDGYMAYFGMPMYQSGYLCAYLMTEDRPDRDVAIVRILRDRGRESDPTVNRRAGFVDYMAEHCPASTLSNVFIDPTNPESIGKTLDDFFAAHPDITSIVMFNSRIHLVASWLESRGKKGFRVIGFDNIPANINALKRGSVTMLITQHPDEQVRSAIKALSDVIVLKKDPPKKDNYMHMDVLTRFNCEYY